MSHTPDTTPFRITVEGTATQEQIDALAKILGGISMLGDGLQLKIQTDIDPEPPEATAAELERDDIAFHTWLDEPLSHDLNTSVNTVLLSLRTYGLLDREGIHTRRDIYTVGKKRIDDITGIGEGSINEIGAAITGAGTFLLPWHNEPNITQIAEICLDISQVPSHVLTHRPDLLANTLRRADDPNNDYKHLQIGDILDLQEPLDSSSNYESFERIKAAAGEFATKFAYAQTQLSR